MKCFLTSNLVIPDTNELNPANGFLINSKLAFQTRAKSCLSVPIPTATNVQFDLLAL